MIRKEDADPDPEGKKPEIKPVLKVKTELEEQKLKIKIFLKIPIFLLFFNFFIISSLP